MTKLILASQSPRRSALLRAAGIEFEVRAAPVDEINRRGLTPSDLAFTLCAEKAFAVATTGQKGCLLAADTVVDLRGEELAKPLVPERNEEYLRRLSGTWHEVHTGICLFDAERGFGYQELCTTRVFMRELTAEEISGYVATGEGLDKAGGYAIQGGAQAFVERIEGDLDTVIGLSMAAVRRGLARYIASGGKLPGMRQAE